MIQTNKYQTPLTDELLDSLIPEVRDEILDAITNIKFIQNLISTDRKKASQLPHDQDGKIIIDLTNPHILEDMDYFRPIALYFKEHKVITKFRPNGNPNSEFGKWIRTEIDRIWNGMKRDSDGEWITGDMYFYLNYCPIIQSKIRKGTKIADRIIDFPEVWEGIYWRFHYIYQARYGGMHNDFTSGQHAAEIAKRGAGKSYVLASILTKVFTVGEHKDTQSGVRAMITAYQKEYLSKDGTLNKFIDMIDFCASSTQFPSKRLKSSMQEMTWRMGYTDTDSNIQKGTKNEVIGVSSRDDVDKLRGKRSSRILIEEFGNFPKIIDIYRIILPSVQDGSYSFGQIYLVGTGGSEGADFAGAYEILYNPRGYNIYALPNVFDKGANGKSESIFFFGAYINRKGCYNNDGVSDIIAALIEICINRYTVKYNSTDSMALTRTKAENPITIQEAIMKRDSTIYPVGDLNETLNNLDQNPTSLDDIYVGELGLTNGTISFIPSETKAAIREFPHKDNKLTGALEIHKMPEKDSDNRVYDSRYIAGIDPYDDDVSGTLSLGSLYILDLWTNRIVCEYTGRPTFADDFYETCRRALLFYNARCNYENNKKGLFAYFSRYNCLYLLTDTLDFLKESDPLKGSNYGNKSKGTVSTSSVKSYARRCIREWLLTPIEVPSKEDPEVTVSIPLLTTLKSRALIKELAQWNPDGNYDRHDALGMLMLLREDKLRLIGTRKASEVSEVNNDYLGNDSFFNKNYKNHSSMIL